MNLLSFSAHAPEDSEEDDDEDDSDEEDVRVIITEKNKLCKLRINDADSKDHGGEWKVRNRVAICLT